MAQVINPNVPKDDSLDTAVAGLNIYNGVSQIRANAAKDAAAASGPASMVSSVSSPKKSSDLSQAMQRRMFGQNY